LDAQGRLIAANRRLGRLRGFKLGLRQRASISIVCL
jgi:hypothetical protein